MNKDGRGWLLVWMLAAIAILLCVCMIQGVALRVQSDEHAAELERMEKVHSVQMHAAVDTPFADPLWLTSEVKRLRLENGALREQIAILEGEVKFLE